MLGFLPIEELKAIIDCLPAPTFVTETESSGAGYRLAALNTAFEAISGLKHGEALGRDPGKLLEGETGALVARFRRCLSLGEQISFEQQVTLPRGARWWQFTVTPLQDRSGRTTRLLGTAKDITKRKAASKDRREASGPAQQGDDTYRAVVEAQSEVIVRTTSDGVLTFVNQAFAGAIGLPARNLIGRRFEEFVPMHARELLAQQLSRCTPEQPIVETEHALLSMNGRAQERLWRDRAFFDSGGQLLGYQYVGLDSGWRMQVERALRESELRFRTLVEGSLQGMCIQRAYKPLFVNQAFANIYGFETPEEALSLDSLLHLVPPRQHQAAVVVWQQALDDPDYRLSVQTKNYRIDGAEIWVEIMGRAIEWRGERALLFSIIDVTERKRFEDQLMKHKEELESQAAALSTLAEDLDAARREAERQRQAAEAASRAKSQFLATMSHELRTPLNAILGFSELIAKEAFGPSAVPQYAEYASDIHSSGQHLLELINDILDIAKIEAGKLEIQPEHLYLAEVLESCLRLNRVRAQEAGLSLELEMHPGSEPLFADERAVKQIVFNLLSNAIKFTPAGGRVRLATRRLEDGGLELSVADEGIGIPTEQMERVLLPFEQVDNSYNRGAGGSGLGLTLVKALAELHGGSLSIESSLGVGTTVRVVFPAGTLDGSPTRQQGDSAWTGLTRRAI